MKKALSLLLALALAAGLAVCAFAEMAKPPSQPPYSVPRFRDYKAAKLAPSQQSLAFELPAVTNITAVWNGDIGQLQDPWHGIQFTPQNVDITIAFADGGKETLTNWYGEGSSNGTWWWWEVFYVYDDPGGKVTFYYSDSNLYRAFGQANGYDFLWEDYRASLQKAVITVPANLREQYMNSLLKSEINLEESQEVALAEGEVVLFAFTPEDGLYFFYTSENIGLPYVNLLDENFEYFYGSYYIDENGNVGNHMRLEGGKTYYFYVCAASSEDTSFNLTVMQMDEAAFSLRATYDYIPFGIYYWIYPAMLIDAQGSEEYRVFLNGEEIGAYDYFQLGGKTPGKIDTVLFTKADGKTELGTLTFESRLSNVQKIFWYFLGGKYWLTRFSPSQWGNEFLFETREQYSERTAQSILDLMLLLWFGM